MKILHIVSTYIPAYEYGGPIESVHALNKGLLGCGLDITVYTTDLGISEKPSIFWDKKKDVSRNIDGVRVYYFPITNSKREYSEEMEKKLKMLKPGDFDLIHITSVFLAVSRLGSYYARKNNIPYIISPRGSLMEAPLQKNFLKKKIYIKFFEAKYLKGASGIHFTSEKEKREYVAGSLPMIKKSCVIANPVDTFAFSKFRPSNFREDFGIPNDAPLILFLGRINWKKGFDTLIPAWRIVIEEFPRARLVIAGPDDGNYLSDVKRMIRKESIAVESILFTGLLTDSIKIGALQHADMFVLPSYSENFGMAVAEAMYFGKPVIITPEVGISDLVKHNAAGRVVSKAPKPFSNAIIELIRNRYLREQLGAKGKEVVLRYFSPRRIGEQMLGFYEEIIESYKK